MKTNTAKKIGGNKRVAKDIGKTVAAFVLFLLYMIPFLLVIINSLKRKISIVKTPLSLVDDKGFQFVNYSEAFQEMQFLKAFGNSIMVVACSVALLIIFSSMCAYILVRKEYLACKVLFLLLVSYMVVIKTSVPIALEEAALIDGCGPFQIFFFIVFPLLKPILSTIMVLQFLGLWNDYLLPSLVLGKPATYTLPIAIRTFVGTFSSDFGNMMAALVMTVFPVIVVYIFLQKYIVGGVVAGAVKS